MNSMYTSLLLESAEILAGSSLGSEKMKLLPVLEDPTSPITVRYIEQLYKAVIDKGHIDFGDIPESKGDIRNYKGYHDMKNTLDIIRELAESQKSTIVLECATQISKAIGNLESLADQYETGYRNHNEYVMLEYNLFTFCCIEATTTVLCEFVEYVKNPITKSIDITLKDTKYRANAFYIDTIKKFNKVNESPEYRKFLTQMNAKSTEQFTGTELLGFGVVVGIAVLIIPVCRALIYKFYNLRRKLSDDLMAQAMFLELHKTCVEANTGFTKEKKDSIIAKQEKIRQLLIRLSDKIKVSNVKADRETEKQLKKDNQLMTFDKIKTGVDNGSFSLL